MMKFNSEGEKLVYNRLKNDGDFADFIILPSLFVSKHLKQMSGEIDLVVLIPGEGVICLEIKHGGVERTKEGKWRFTRGDGEVTEKYKGPFQQVHDTMHSLRKMIDTLTKTNPHLNKRFSKLMFGTGVMFTSLNEFNDLGPEGERWQLFLRKDFGNLKSYFKKLTKGWHEKYQCTPNAFWYNDTESRPTAKECELLKNTLRGDFTYDYALLNRINDEENTIEELTKEQFDILDFASDNSRILVQGAAGTGKTILALELARRKTDEGIKTAVLCYNKLLGEEMRMKINKINPKFNKTGYAGTIHSYLLSKTKLNVPEEDSGDFWNVTLPNEYVLQYLETAEDNKFDYIIIDEAQDVLTETYMDVIDCMLKGGLKSGNWTFGGDFSNQAIFVNDPAKCLLSLTERANYSTLKLQYNCRNPKLITTLNTHVTGCDLIKSRNGMPDGERITLKFPKTVTESIEIIESILKDLELKKIPLNKVTILTPINSNICKDSSYIKNSVTHKGLVLSTIQGYKGLENSNIIITGFDELSSDLALRHMYVAISRTKFKLFLVLNKSVEDQYNNQLAKNIHKLLPK